MNKLNIILSGIVRNNPTFVLVLGMCPTLGTTTSAGNGMGMGLATMAVLIMSNLVISLIKNIIPDKVRIPAFIVVIASFVTVVEMLMKAYTPPLYEALGVFIPLIVVNCIILGRAEAFASKNTPLDSILDGVGIGLGFTLALTVIGAVREILGSGAIFGISLGTADYMPLIFVLAPGAFLVLGMCPTLGTTTSAENGMGMGLATMAVLIMSNLVISLIKNIIPDKVRIPAFIVVIASFVTIIQMLMQAYVPALYGALGVFIPLIVVNCIILGRAEAFASKNSPLDSILDGVGIGLGFTLALTVIGAVREILGSGAIFGVNLGFADVAPLIFVLAPGAFLVLGYLMVLFNKLAKK